MKIDLKKDMAGSEYIETNSYGYELLTNPILNKGSSFSSEEISSLKLRGLVPVETTTLSKAVNEIYQIINQKDDNFDRHLYLRSLQDCNETLFYAVLNRYPEETMPVIYTPTVGQACQRFSQIYQSPRGVFISYPDRNHIDEILENSRFDDTEVIVVSDGERVLGLGDQGIGGMGITIGKLSLYTMCAGIPPYKTLPIVLDNGTDNESLLNDPSYLGWRNRRIRGQEYDEFIEKFILAVRKRFPNLLLQWEDFAQPNALNLLNRYKGQLCCFNDDIQGTAAVVVSTLLAASNALINTKLPQQKIVVVGAGSAGVGISNLIIDAMVDLGAERRAAVENIFLVDRDGLITDKVKTLAPQQPFVKSLSSLHGWNIANDTNISLLETVSNTQATIIIGVSTQAGIFTREIIEKLANHCERPIIFPLSNPTNKAEAHPHDILTWTKGKAIVGTGSPFPPYITGKNQRRIDQVNNCYIFPGIGLGIRAVNSKRITDQMFLIAAKALADLSPAKDNLQSTLLPSLKEMRKVSRHIAIKIAKESVRSGLTEIKNLDEKTITDLIDQYIWKPIYLPYRKKVA